MLGTFQSQFGKIYCKPCTIKIFTSSGNYSEFSKGVFKAKSTGEKRSSRIKTKAEEPVNSKPKQADPEPSPETSPEDTTAPEETQESASNTSDVDTDDQSMSESEIPSDKPEEEEED